MMKEQVMFGSAAAIVAIMWQVSAAHAQPYPYPGTAVYPTTTIQTQTTVPSTVPPGTVIIQRHADDESFAPSTPRQPGVVNAPGTPHSSGSSHLAAPVPAEDYMLPPAAQTGASGVRYVSGGIGAQGQQEIAAVQGDYSLKLTFAASSGHYLANVNVEIIDSKGEVLVSTVTDGPILLAQLPAGSYTVRSTYENASQTKKVSVGSSGLNSYTVLYTQPIT